MIVLYWGCCGMRGVPIDRSAHVLYYYVLTFFNSIHPRDTNERTNERHNRSIILIYFNVVRSKEWSGPISGTQYLLLPGQGANGGSLPRSLTRDVSVAAAGRRRRVPVASCPRPKRRDQINIRLQCPSIGRHFEYREYIYIFIVHVLVHVTS